MTDFTNNLEILRQGLENNQKYLNELQITARDYKLADWMHERLVEAINSFEENLPDNMQAGGKFVAFQDTIINIEDLGYMNPDIIIFYGKLSDGSEVELVQHTSQLNLLLVAVPRLDTSKPRRKIGFAQEPQEDK